MLRLGTGDSDFHNHRFDGGFRRVFCDDRSGQWAVSGFIDASDNVEGAEPGFSDAARQDFTPRDGSPLIDNGAVLPAAAVGHPLESQYVKHQSYAARPAFALNAPGTNAAPSGGP